MRVPSVDDEGRHAGQAAGRRSARRCCMLPPPRGPLGLPAGIWFDGGQQRFVCLITALARHSQGSRQGIHQVTAAFPDPGMYRPGASTLRGSGSSGPTVSSHRAVFRVRPEGARCGIASRSAAFAIAGAMRPPQANMPGFVAGERAGCTRQPLHDRKQPDNKKPRKSEVLSFVLGCCRTVQWCPREDSNLHGFTRQYLKLVRLPIPPPGQSGRAFSR